MTKYTKTVVIHSPLQLDSLHIGQWFKFGDTGQRGQYLGTTLSGSDACVYQNKFCKANAKRVKLIRKWAKSNGAK
jgi:hypothetical protein